MKRVRTRTPLTTLKSALLRGGLVAGATAMCIGLAPHAASASSDTPSDFHAWHTPRQFVKGKFDSGAALVFHGRPGITLNEGETKGTWTSPEYSPSLPINQLVSSWQANTPKGTWIETQLSTKVGNHWSGWYNMGKWASGDDTIKRTSVPNQSDDDGTIYTDTYVSNADPASKYKLREVLHGTAHARPTVYQVGATASDPKKAGDTTSTTTMHRTVNLPVPQYSQETHKGEYPQYDGGGEAWCSPTSTAMVLSYYHRGPSKADVASLPADKVFDANHRADGVVDWAAVHTYDQDYNGTGNWPFNTAYASSYGLDGSVRQYNSLRGVEHWIKKGVPVVASIAWDNTDSSTANDLTGAAIPKSSGHLLVIRGFTKDGHVIANDPAAPNNGLVRRLYQRDQFERVWQNASAGTVYVIKSLGNYY